MVKVEDVKINADSIPLVVLGLSWFEKAQEN